jgi:hypothetical protein
MKKFLVICGLALALSALSREQASAWHKFNFNVGLNISWEAANNCYFCGLFTSGPAPYGYAPYDGGFGYPAFPPAHGFDGYHAAAPAAPAAPQAVAQPAAQPAAQGPVRQAQYSWGQVGYYPTSYSGYGYGTSVPSYWYGN